MHIVRQEFIADRDALARAAWSACDLNQGHKMLFDAHTSVFPAAATHVGRPGA